MKSRTECTRWMVVLAATAALLAGCTRAGSRAVPTLYVTATGDLTEPVTSVADGSTLAFVSGGGQIAIVLGNTGDAPLNITKIEVTSKNRDMSVLPNLLGLSWPRVVAAGDFRSTDRSVLNLAIHFTPGASPEDTLTTLKITTDDDAYVGGVFTFSVAPQEKEPELAVNPPNYVFLNATATTSDSVDILLSNTGSEALALGDIYFETTTSAYTLVGGRPNRDTIIDPDNTGAGNGPQTLHVEYLPVEPPDQNRLVVEWGKVLQTGVTCTADKACQDDATLCGDASLPCPYTCGNGHCMCTRDEDCAAYLLDEGARCMTGVCRVPDKAYVDLRGETQAGQLKVEYADQLAGCVDFTAITEVDQTCTKLVKLSNVGAGLVKVSRPSTTVAADLDNPYTMEWYRLGATQAEDCGAVTGTAITENQFSLTEQNGPITVAVTYKAPGAKAPNGELVIPYASPFAGEEHVPLCGGFKKGELEVAPPPRSSNIVMFAREPSNQATKTVVIMNKGNDTLELKGVSAAPVNPGIDPEGFHVLNPPTGADLIMKPGALYPLTVQFDGTVIPLDENSDAVVLNGFLYIDYVDPLIGDDARETVNLNGWVNVKNVTLPTADPGTSADYAGASVGVPFVLDGSGSTGGSFEIPDGSGYTWFIAGKPDASKVFTNPGPSTSKVTVIPDVAGDYTFKLVVFAYDPDSRLSFFSDEGSVVIHVAAP